MWYLFHFCDGCQRAAFRASACHSSTLVLVHVAFVSTDHRFCTCHAQAMHGFMDEIKLDYNKPYTAVHLRLFGMAVRQGRSGPWCTGLIGPGEVNEWDLPRRSNEVCQKRAIVTGS